MHQNPTVAPNRHNICEMKLKQGNNDDQSSFSNYGTKTN